MTRTTFNPADFGKSVASLLAPRVIPLGPGQPNRAMEPQLLNVDLIREWSPSSPNKHAVDCCLSGLWLYHDFLEQSHQISQGIDTPEGSFWHAIMHRREPDAWNAKYWWRKVGAHPVLDLLAEQAPALGYHYTSPLEFVDFCEKARGSGSAEEEIAQRVQLLEWRLLFDHCYRKALG